MKEHQNLQTHSPWNPVRLRHAATRRAHSDHQRAVKAHRRPRGRRPLEKSPPPAARAGVHLGCVSLSLPVLRRPLASKQTAEYAGILWTRRDTTGQTDLDRTQEVVGSSPTSSTGQIARHAGRFAVFGASPCSGWPDAGHQVWASYAGLHPTIWQRRTASRPNPPPGRRASG